MKHNVHKALSTYAVLRGECNYFFYLIHAVFSRIGDSIDALAYSWIAYQITGSAVWLAIIAGLNSLPTIFITPLVAPLVEKLPKKLIMCAATLARGALVCLTGVLMLLSRLTVWHLAVITLCMSTIESFSDPAFMACMPRIIPQEKMDAALSLRSILTRSCQLLGTALGGVLIGTLGGAWALSIDGLLFLLAALPLMTLHLKPEEPAQPDAPRESYFAAFRGGFSYFVRNHALFALCMTGVFFNVLIGPLGQMEAAFVVEVLHLDALALSVAGVASSMGMLAGSMLYPVFSPKLSFRRILVYTALSCALCYGSLVALGLVPFALLRYIGIGVLELIMMLCVSFFSLSSNVLFFKAVDSAYLARMASIFNAFSMLGVPLASVYGGTLVKLLSVRSVFLIGCVMMLVCALLASRLRVFTRMEELRRDVSNPSTEQEQDETAHSRNA